jgi:hypothetical protein
MAAPKQNYKVTVALLLASALTYCQASADAKRLYEELLQMRGYNKVSRLYPNLPLFHGTEMNTVHQKPDATILTCPCTNAGHRWTTTHVHALTNHVALLLRDQPRGLRQLVSDIDKKLTPLASTIHYS